MWTTRQRNEAVRLLGKRAFLAALCIVVATAVFGVWNVAQKEQESAALRTQAEKQLADLETRQGQLSTQIQKLQTDRGMEEALRDQYQLAAAGEHLIVIVDPATTVAPAATTTLLDKIKHALWWW